MVADVLFLSFIVIGLKRKFLFLTHNAIFQPLDAAHYRELNSSLVSLSNGIKETTTTKKKNHSHVNISIISGERYFLD